MLDLRLIRRDPDAVRTALARRGPEAAERLDQVLALDARWREATQAAEALRAQQKAASEELAAGKREGRDVSEQLTRLKTLSVEVKSRAEQARGAEAALQQTLRTLPNLPDPTAAEPEDEVLRHVGEAGEDGSRPPRARGRHRSTWSAARGCRARAFRSSAATWRCSSSRSCSGS